MRKLLAFVSIALLLTAFVSSCGTHGNCEAYDGSASVQPADELPELD